MALEAFVLTYGQRPAKRRDIFPARKQTMTARRLDETGDEFEDTEKEQFGEGVYEDALKHTGDIEGGLVDISQFTAPPPPKASGA